MGLCGHNGHIGLRQGRAAQLVGGALKLLDCDLISPLGGSRPGQAWFRVRPNRAKKLCYGAIPVE